jgi:hypothetical protein
MKPCAFSSVVLALFCWSTAAPAADLAQLKVLYVGDSASSSRTRQVTAFLQKNVSQVEAVPRRGFNPDQARDFDVVVLDWPQSGTSDQERQQESPLGKRAKWNKPTLLLGSAGLNLAVVWKVRGGSG